MANNSKIVCPLCGYTFNDDDIYNADNDLYAMTTGELEEYESCPNCEKSFYIQGGYTPFWDTFKTHYEAYL